MQFSVVPVSNVLEFILYPDPIENIDILEQNKRITCIVEHIDKPSVIGFMHYQQDILMIPLLPFVSIDFFKATGENVDVF